MAQIKVSQFAEASSSSEDDVFMVIQNGVNKKITLKTLLKNLNSNDTIKFNPLMRPIDLIISSANNSSLFKIDGLNGKIGINAPSISSDSLLHVNGVIRAGTTNSDGIFAGSSEIISHPANSAITNAPISIFRETTALEIYGNSTYILSSGVEGQTKIIYLKNIDSAGATAKITVSQGLGFNRIYLQTSVGNSINLKFINSSWIVIGNNGAILTTE